MYRTLSTRSSKKILLTPRKLEITITHIFTVVPKHVNVMCSSHSCVGVVSGKDKRDFEPTTEGLVEHETGLECGYEREP